jgi:ABC-type sugar transport system, periplasmic component
MKALRCISFALISAALLSSLAIAVSCAKKAPGRTTGSAGDFVFTGKPDASITFLSTQLNPVEEAAKMRNEILKDYPGAVDFMPNDNSYLFSQISSMVRSDPTGTILVGALHGDLVKLYEQNALQPLNGLYDSLRARGFPENLVRLSRLNGTDIFYIPWMQASFVMVANRKALPYLPAGADLNTLTYDQLAQWAKNIQDRTGMRAIGFPAGAKGLMHRFFQGFLYPSFTGSTLVKFRSPEAVAMWTWFRDLWQYVNQGSLVYSTMSDPLLSGDVWIAWDHTARLMKAFRERPGDFVAFPAPAGPQGRGFMAVISGLAIPQNAADSRNQSLLIDYLTQPAIQKRTLKETGFFPVVDTGTGEDIPPYLAQLNAAMNRQVSSVNSHPCLMPIGLGVRGDDFNNCYMLTFSEIVLEGKDARTVLDRNAAELQGIIDEQNIPCWLPDVQDGRPCKLD